MASVPLYCPYWGGGPGGCRWDHESTGKTAQDALKIHLRVCHPGRVLPEQPKLVAKPRPVKVAAARAVAPPREVTWTKELVVAAIQAFNTEHGRPPTAREWKTPMPGCPSAQTVGNRFGSWNAGILAAGFQPRTVSDRVTRPKGRARTITTEQCITALQEAARELGRPPGAKWWRRSRRSPSVNAITLRFGSWRAALQAADLDPDLGGPRWSAKRPTEILHAITAWADAHDGQPPSQVDWRRSTDEHPDFSIAQRAFGSWNHAIQLAGLTPRPQGRRRTAAQLRAALTHAETLEAKHLRLSIQAREQADSLQHALEAA